MLMDFSRLSVSTWPLFTQLPSTSRTERRRRYNLSRTLGTHTLDRVNVLGNDEDYGHTGCVNALNWARDGQFLLTGGDDTTVRIWKMDTSDNKQEYPFVCRSVIDTSHRANIFSTKMLPRSSRIVTAAGDKQVRVFDVNAALGALNTSAAGPGDIETNYSTNQCCIRVLRCHHDAVKKIVAEDSPDLFLSLSEDGTVRQHDLRTSHTCDRRSCPAPLVDVGHELSTVSFSPLIPHQIVVAGEGPYGYLYDRRYSRLSIERDWGRLPKAGKAATTCVRKFGRGPSQKHQNSAHDHITGSRLSQSNGHELLLCFVCFPRSACGEPHGQKAYSADGIYLFSTKDDPVTKDDMTSPDSSGVQQQSDEISPTTEADAGSGSESDRERLIFNLLGSSHGEEDYQPNIPTILPRRRYSGARNIVTVKDVNFIGPNDQWVVSGSDDGNFFVWDKQGGNVQGIYEGDSSVVNVVESHPHFPLLAVSGIDTTVKLFAPTYSDSSFSRMANMEQIMEHNRRARPLRFPSYNIAALLAEARNAAEGAEGGRVPIECIGQ